MLSVKDKGILLNIIDHCKRIEENLTGLDREKFDKDNNIKDSICFNILQIGELAKHLSDEFSAIFSKVPWRQIKGMRDVIAHGYGTIEWERVYRTATNDIKPLREYCEEIIKSQK